MADAAAAAAVPVTGASALPPANGPASSAPKAPLGAAGASYPRERHYRHRRTLRAARSPAGAGLLRTARQPPDGLCPDRLPLAASAASSPTVPRVPRIRAPAAATVIAGAPAAVRMVPASHRIRRCR